MTINQDKCELNCDKVSYSRYQLLIEGISPDERLTKKIAEMFTQRNKKELKYFLDETNF